LAGKLVPWDEVVVAVTTELTAETLLAAAKAKVIKAELKCILIVFGVIR